MPRKFSGGADMLSWVPATPQNATQFRPITLVGWADNWANNSVNDRRLISKCFGNHTGGEFSLFLGAFEPVIGNKILAFWHNPWSVSNGEWNIVCPIDNGWHMFSVQYDPVSPTEVPEMSFDLVQGGIIGDISHQPSGDFFVDFPGPPPIEIGNNAGSPDPSWDGSFWRFAWWDAKLTRTELRQMYEGKSPELIRPQNLMLFVDMEGAATGEYDRGRFGLGYATVTGTKKSLDAPAVYQNKRFGNVGLRKAIQYKGSSPTGNVSIAGQPASSGQGAILFGPAPVLSSFGTASKQGVAAATVVTPLTGQTMASQQGNIGSFKAPIIVTIGGLSVASAVGTVTPENATPLVGQQANSLQGLIGTGRQATVALPGIGMAIAAGTVNGAPAPNLVPLSTVAIQGQLYIDAQTEYLQQNWIKAEGPP